MKTCIILHTTTYNTTVKKNIILLKLFIFIYFLLLCCEKMLFISYHHSLYIIVLVLVWSLALRVCATPARYAQQKHCAKRLVDGGLHRGKGASGTSCYFCLIAVVGKRTLTCPLSTCRPCVYRLLNQTSSWRASRRKKLMGCQITLSIS